MVAAFGPGVAEATVEAEYEGPDGEDPAKNVRGRNSILFSRVVVIAPYASH